MADVKNKNDNYEPEIYNHKYDNLSVLFESDNESIAYLEKYQLVKIDERCEILPINPPRIYFIELKKTINVANVCSELLYEFEKLKKNNLIDKLAIRLSNNNYDIEDGRNEKIMITDSIEYGQFFSIDSLTNINVTKLYSENYKNNLWIKISDTDITFEELCEEDKTYKDSIVTQVIHIQYKKTNTDIMITHLDHEFVFYDLNDYINRENNAWIKGEKYPRLKSFKIDNAKIPINYKVEREVNKFDEIETEEVLFLILVLKNYFYNKELIDEYFSKLK